MDNTTRNLFNEVFNNLNYIGLNPVDIIEDYNLRGGRQLAIYFKFNNFTPFDSPQEQISKICDPFYDNLANSPYIRHIKHSHQKEIQTLKEEIKRLQELNMNLSEGISNGAEYLEMHCDGVKEVKVEG
jgi:hypothetical protein